MARETAAQRKAREQAERTQAEQAFLASYPRRLLNLVFEYSNKNSNVFTVDRLENDQFLFETAQDWAREFVLPAELTEYNQSVFVDMLEAEDALKAYDCLLYTSDAADD